MKLFLRPMAATAMAAAAIAPSALQPTESLAQSDASAASALSLSPQTRDLGGWKRSVSGPRAKLSFERRGKATRRALRVSDLRGSGVAAITAKLPRRSRVSVKAVVKVYRMRLMNRASRPLIWVGGTGGRNQQAGIIRVRGALRWATWYLTPSGARTKLKVGRRVTHRKAWQHVALTTVWSRQNARTLLKVGGKVVARSRALRLRSVRATRVSVGLGRASKGRASSLVRLRSAVVRLKTIAPAPGAAPVAAPALKGKLPAEVEPYSPTFAFNETIPANTPTDPRSAAIVGQLAGNASSAKVTLTSDGEVPPVYVASPGDPLLKVNVGGVSTSFRVPAGAVAGTGSDHPLVLLDPSHPQFGKDTELRLWQASISGTSLSASGAGLFHYNNDGAVLNPDGSQSVSVPFAGSGTGSGLSILAGLIRGDEVKQGEIRHALRFAYSAGDFTSKFRAPAIKSDQPKNTSTRNPATAMDMGMRLQLDPSVNCDTRTVPGTSATSGQTRYLRMICHALQQYGMIAVDGTGTGGLLFQAENNATADWNAIVGPTVNGSYGYILRDATSPSDGLQRDANSGIPWSRMRVLASSEY